MNGDVIACFVTDWFGYLLSNRNNFKSINEYMNKFFEYTENDDDSIVMFVCISGSLSGMTKDRPRIVKKDVNIISFPNYPKINEFIMDWCYSVFELGLSFGARKKSVDYLEPFLEYVKKQNQANDIFLKISVIVLQLQLSQIQPLHEGDSQ